MRAVSTNHEVEADLILARTARLGAGLVLHLEPGLALAEVGAGQLVVEEERDVGQLIEDVQQAAVEPAAVNGKDGLGWLETEGGGCSVR